ncbi:hypothetical protein NUSPORA_01407 [Nucleospora cyclopteri]
MVINAKKSGIMIFPQNEPGTFINFNDDEIEVVTQYTYLGIEVNAEFDEGKMAKGRIQKGYQTLAILTPSLKDKLIPLEYKRMLIANVLIPRITYGIALFAGKYPNVRPIKKIVNRAISLAKGKSNFSIARVYEDLGLPQIEPMSKYFTAKSFVNWKEADSIAWSLLSSENYFKKTRKKTWLIKTQTFIKRYVKDIDYMSKKNIKREIIKIFKMKEQFNPGNKANKMGKCLALGNGRKIRVAELNGQSGAKTIQKFRMKPYNE